MTEQEKREKVIEGLEMSYRYSNVDEDNTLVPQQLVLDAIALLKAQEPVEPKMMEFVDKGLTWEKYEVPTCGVCGTLLGGALFCPQCGRAVKWE